MINRLELPDVEKTGSAECSNMIGHGKLTIQVNTKVFDCS